MPAQTSHTWVVVFSNLPRAHGEHVVRGFDGCEMEPAPHGIQLWLPRPDAYSSALQSAHTPLVPAEPAAQESQPFLFKLASWPLAQRSQSLLPGALLMNPLGHAVHAVSASLLLYCPETQAVQEVRAGVPLEFTTEPAAHVMHAALVPVTGA